MATELSVSTFDESIAGETPVLVDFWAEWCAPCRAIAPILEDLAGELEGRLTITKLNIDEHPEIGQRYDVMAIPTLLVFRKGELIERIQGLRSKGQLRAAIDPHL